MAAPISLDEARAWLRERVDAGETCPCCTQFAKVYRRKLSASIARVLIAMWNNAGSEWVHLPAIRSRGQDEVLARHWELIEAMPDVTRDDGSSRVGWWRLTPRGTDFVHNHSRVPKYARIYNNRLLGYDGTETVSIIDALGTRFNYTDLMAGV